MWSGWSDLLPMRTRMCCSICVLLAQAVLQVKFYVAFFRSLPDWRKQNRYSINGCYVHVATRKWLGTIKIEVSSHEPGKMLCRDNAKHEKRSIYWNSRLGDRHWCGLFIILNLYIFTRQSFFIVVHAAKQWAHISEDFLGVDMIFRSDWMHQSVCVRKNAVKSRWIVCWTHVAFFIVLWAELLQFNTAQTAHTFIPSVARMWIEFMCSNLDDTNYKWKWSLDRGDARAMPRHLLYGPNHFVWVIRFRHPKQLAIIYCTKLLPPYHHCKCAIWWGENLNWVKCIG